MAPDIAATSATSLCNISSRFMFAVTVTLHHHSRCLGRGSTGWPRVGRCLTPRTNALPTAALGQILLQIAHFGCSEHAPYDTYTGAIWVAIRLNWAFGLVMRYPPVDLYSAMRSNTRYERTTPNGPVRELALPRLHRRLPQPGEVSGQTLADSPRRGSGIRIVTEHC